MSSKTSERIKTFISLLMVGLLIAVLQQNAQLKKLVAQNTDGIGECTWQARNATDYASEAADSASEAADYSSEAADAAYAAADYASNCPGN